MQRTVKADFTLDIRGLNFAVNWLALCCDLLMECGKFRDRVIAAQLPRLPYKAWFVVLYELYG
ncbi:MAG: hypothetical protein J6T96_11365 [Bacteroidales bacterium]|nr:hypothetical protein [Bacteroidales bacterium]MBO7463182.1 hypothetical protein [Bacteroidales bacterium]